MIGLFENIGIFDRAVANFKGRIFGQNGRGIRIAQCLFHHLRCELLFFGSGIMGQNRAVDRFTHDLQLGFNQQFAQTRPNQIKTGCVNAEVKILPIIIPGGIGHTDRKDLLPIEKSQPFEGPLFNHLQHATEALGLLQFNRFGHISFGTHRIVLHQGMGPHHDRQQHQPGLFFFHWHTLSHFKLLPRGHVLIGGGP